MKSFFFLLSVFFLFSGVNLYSQSVVKYNFSFTHNGKDINGADELGLTFDLGYRPVATTGEIVVFHTTEEYTDFSQMFEIKDVDGDVFNGNAGNMNIYARARDRSGNLTDWSLPGLLNVDQTIPSPVKNLKVKVEFVISVE